MQKPAPSTILAIAVIAVGLLLRMLAVPPAVADVDGVNFARALLGYDPLRQAPHFPGYPVYIAAAAAMRAVGVASDTWALGLPAIVSWPFAGALFFAGLRRRVGLFPALGGLVVGALAPAAVLWSGAPASDGLGLSLLFIAAGALAWGARAGDVSGAIVLGVLLGVRLSWWPLGLVALFVPSRGRTSYPTRCLGLAIGVFVWLIPLAVITGPVALVELAIGFTTGHATVWGGTAIADPASLFHRAATVLDHVSFAGLGFGAVVVMSTICIAGAVTLRREQLPLMVGLATTIVIYGAWLVGFQNVDKIRHTLPLLPLLGVGFGFFARETRLHALLAVALLAVAIPRALTQHQTLLPAAAMVAYVMHDQPGAAAIFAGEEARVFEHFAPAHRVIRPADGGVLQREAQRLTRQGVPVWVSSGAPGFETLAPDLHAVATFAIDPRVRAHDANLTLYRYGSGASP